jgi:serine/threonine-protein kinase RsbW
MIIDISLQSKFSKVVATSKLVRQYCTEKNIPKDDCDEIEICVVEALNNIIEHSYGRIESHQIKIELIFEKLYLQIKITDKGNRRKNFEKAELKINPSDIQSLPERGMGLFIIEKLMDKTSYETQNDSNTFTMTKYYG